MKKLSLALTLPLLVLSIGLGCSCSYHTPMQEDPTESSPESGTPSPETAPDDLAPYRVTSVNDESGLDFVIDFPAGKDLTVLQITDTQMQTMAGARNETRRIQVGNAFFSALPDDFEFRVWRYMDEAVEKACPDLIVLTGDNIYGELDDSGAMWLALIEKMDSYEIPWCVIFGNHDNESAMGVTWQIEQLMNSEYCIFKQGSVTGNCNYNLLIRQGGEAKFLFYMMDSNGCHTNPNNPGEGLMPDNVDIEKLQQTPGFGSDQKSWLRKTAGSIRESYGEVPVLLFYHIPIIDIAQSILEIYPSAGNLPFSPDRPGDLGMAKEMITGVSCGRLWRDAKLIGCTGMFVGHQHTVATSIECDGIRVTYGLKTGTYDYHDKELLGSTKITLAEHGGTFAVEYLYSSLPYQP